MRKIIREIINFFSGEPSTRSEKLTINLGNTKEEEEEEI
jgi:hypothetical protein